MIAKNNCPVTVYNTDKKEVLGIFAMQSLVAKYLYPTTSRAMTSRVNSCIRNKSKIIQSKFDFPITIRHSTIEQIKILGENKVLIMNDYPKFDEK